MHNNNIYTALVELEPLVNIYKYVLRNYIIVYSGILYKRTQSPFFTLIMNLNTDFWNFEVDHISKHLDLLHHL